jgi:hypothetical protein
VVELDGLITNGKFCCVRRLRLSLTWWRRPLRLRASVLQTDVALSGEPDDPDPDVLLGLAPTRRIRQWIIAVEASRNGPRLPHVFEPSAQFTDRRWSCRTLVLCHRRPRDPVGVNHTERDGPEPV